MGFEPGTFRSLVEHSNHCATEAQRIPDVLVVLLNIRNVSMTSYETHAHAHAHTHNNIARLVQKVPAGKIFGLYRFFNIFLQISYLLTWRIWGGPTHGPPFAPNQPRTLGRPVPDLGVNVSDNLRRDVIIPIF